MTRFGVADDELGLFTDLYELTMLQAYHEQRMDEVAVFDLFPRRLPRTRNYLLACGLDDALAALEKLRFDSDAVDHLQTLGLFRDEFLDSLRGFRFTGDVHAVPEGTPVFANEPILEVAAPLGEAQLAESILLNVIHGQTLVASKAARVVEAARGRRVVDFGMRRAHGADAAVNAARAAYIAGAQATSNVLAGVRHGIPVTGTMAHSYVSAHDDEAAAFRDFARLYPDTTLLVDTYDTLEGVRRVVDLARELGTGFRVRAIRLDSGDLKDLAQKSRVILDEAGLQDVEIVASSNLDEHEIARLVEAEAPIAGFGVGTSLATSSDAPALDLVYKLVAYAGSGRMKLSEGKVTLPGAKQVFRVLEGEEAVRDVIGLRGGDDEVFGGREGSDWLSKDESSSTRSNGETEQRRRRVVEGEPLLVPVMRGGRRTREGIRSLDEIREHARASIAKLPPRVRGLAPANAPYSVELSAGMKDELARVSKQIQARNAPHSS